MNFKRRKKRRKILRRFIKIEFLSHKNCRLSKIMERIINKLINRLSLNPRFKTIHPLVLLKITYMAMEYLTIKVLAP